MNEIKVFDTEEDDNNKSEYTSVTIHMTTEVERDHKPSWMPQWRPCVVVTLERRGNCAICSEQRGLKNIDACIVQLGKIGIASLIGYAASTHIEIYNVRRVRGYRSKFASETNDLNTGRIILDFSEGAS